LNPGRRGGKQATNRLSYGAAVWWGWGHIELFHISILYIIFASHYSIVKIVHISRTQMHWHISFSVTKLATVAVGSKAQNVFA
jgi:hypothetical protein